MLLAGVKVQMENIEVRDEELRTSLTTIKENIIWTVEKWLAPPASPDEIFKAALAILRALPRLIRWLDGVDNATNKKLGALLFERAEKNKTDETLFSKINNTVPTELKDLIQEGFTQNTLADLLVGRLEQIYGLNKGVAQQLVTEGMGHLEEYRAFRTRLWEHDWQSGPCEPPMVRSNSTAEVTHALQSLRF